MTTLNDIADALETIVGTITDLKVYSEPEEDPTGPKGGASAEIVLRERHRIANAGTNSSTWSVEVSCPSDDKGWSRGVRQVRTHLDATGDSSVEAKLRATPALGIGVATGNIRVEAERRVQYGSGWRWVGRVLVDVVYS